jgi:hypothetical protein
MNVDLLSPLPRAECAERLRRHVSSQFALVTDSGVVGTVDGDSFVIRKRIQYRNSFQRRLYGQISDAPGGTRIHGEIRERDLRWVFIAGGVVTAVAFFGVFIPLFAYRAELGDVPLIALIGPALVVPLLVLIMIGAVALGRRLARSEEAFLVDWVKRTLDAREAA